MQRVDAESGSPLGCSVYTENWHNGKRQPAGVAYNLANVHILMKSLVSKIVIEEGAKSARGIQLDDGRQIAAAREVIVCCG